MEYDVTSFIGQCLEAYESLAEGNFQPYKRALTPFLSGDSLPAVEDESDGVLASIVLNVMKKVLYMARIGREVILRATTFLAKQVAKWSITCDRQLHRLVPYLNHTKSLKA